MDTVSMGQRNSNGIAILNNLTAGAITAAATKAACASLLLRINYDCVEFHTSDDRLVPIPVRFIPHPESNAIREYAVIIGPNNAIEGLSGVTEVHVSVERVRKLSDIPDKIYIKPEFINLYLGGGEGVATLSENIDIGIAGYAAIDKEARNLIFQAAADVLHFADVMPLLKIIVSTKSVQQLSQTQCAILGSGGDVVPTSQNDILMDVARTIQEQYDSGIRHVVAAPGNSGHKYVQDAVHVSMAHCIRCRNYLGNTIDMAATVGMENFLLVGNASKIIRLAAGIMDTHTWNADGRREVLSLHTVLAGGTISQARIIQDIATTDQMLSKLTEWGLRDAVMASVCTKIKDYVQNRIGGKSMKFGVIPVHYSYGVLGQTPDISEVFAAVSREQFALSVKK
ncbi:MAG: cobalt-precorrin-5B (C(1))-methyltransferase [Butyrivibrio sp.]|nr:cobalt-precorrin-5B (C(1))-methyltransferase [Butyrivibrio sp.]